MHTKLLKKAFLALGKILPKKPSHPILGFVRLHGDGEVLTISGVNLSQSLSVQLPGDGRAIDALAPFPLLKKLITKCQDQDEVWFAAEDGLFVVQGKSFEFKFRTLPVAEYPPLRNPEILSLLPVPKRPKWVDAFAPFVRPQRIHPEAGTLEPESREAFTQLLWQLSEVQPMPDYVIELEQMKDAVVISLRPDEAYEVACGSNQAIVVSGDEAQLQALEGKYCLVHAAAVEGEVLAESTNSLRELGVSVEDAPNGHILGYCQISGIQKYATEQEWKEGNEKGYHLYSCTLKQYQELLETTDPLYGVIVSSPVMLMEYVPMGGEISEGFWSPEVPWETSALRKAFEVGNVGVDVDRDIRLPESLKK